MAISHNSEQLKCDLPKMQSNFENYIGDVARIRRETSNTASGEADNGPHLENNGRNYAGEIGKDEDVLVLEAAVHTRLLTRCQFPTIPSTWTLKPQVKK